MRAISGGMPAPAAEPRRDDGSAGRHDGKLSSRPGPAGKGAGVGLEIDVSTAHPARVYDVLLGGKDNFPADREAADALLAAVPQAQDGARENRAFLQRAVRYLAGQAGIDQFLDIGTGLPTQGNVHEVAQAVVPGARVAYVDNDPIVCAHARALLADQATTIAIQADLRQPEAILDHPEVRRLLDFGRPIGLLLVAVLHFVRDEEDPAGLVARLAAALAPGSYVVVSHATGDFHPDLAAQAVRVYARASAPLVPRSYDQILGLLDGFQLVAPGLVQPAAWRPDPDLDPDDLGSQGAGGFYAGVGRKSCARATRPPSGPEGGGMRIGRKVVRD